MITTTYYPKAQSILYSLLGFLFLGSNTQVNGHGVEVRYCLTTSPANNLRIFVEHWHDQLTSVTQPGGMVIKDNVSGISSTFYPSGLANNVDADNGAILPGCSSGDPQTIATSCGRVENNWVYYDFPFFCDTNISYSFLEGLTYYLEEGCANLYPATISPYENCPRLPSASPSTGPSSSPSGMPSSTPSQQPSSFPSQLPSASPSTGPSSSPSGMPSSAPSQQPSSFPSQLPSALPSTEPSSSPSEFPSSAPSSEPSTYPSKQPSSRPSVLPTGEPSFQPSDEPSNVPSIEPSNMPSSAPSCSKGKGACPKSTKAPSMKSTKVPSVKTTAAPYAKSTKAPYAKSTKEPYAKSTKAPYASKKSNYRRKLRAELE